MRVIATHNIAVKLSDLGWKALRMKAGDFIITITYCIFAMAEKKHVAIAAENINVNAYYAFPSSQSYWLLTSLSAG